MKPTLSVATDSFDWNGKTAWNSQLLGGSKNGKNNCRYAVIIVDVEQVQDF
jgi:hypothetical protein